ncbi:MAG TPA: segregation/condensation protein A [Terriglobales bacterium]|nr:segregation/condensation protein A [Terriglobales bacterium]
MSQDPQAASPAAAAEQSLTLRIGEFEGPLDLLLHLCRTNEIDLAQLPVRAITDQYLAHLEAFEFQDLETAGAYLVMAATLIYLKSKLLVPPDEDAADEQLDDEALALKQELEERLREYARVKALGGALAEREAAQALLWGRPSSHLPSVDDIPLEDLSVHLLERALKHLIEEQQRRKPRQVEANPPSVLERMTEILSLLRDTWSMLFSTLAGGERRRADVVVTLLAVLELVRQGRIRAQQTDLFGEIVLERRNETDTPPDTPAEGLDSVQARTAGGLGGPSRAPHEGEITNAEPR